MEEIRKLIETCDSIVIARHKHPDMDAYGSQFGLYYTLKEKFPKKQIYVVGDINALNYFQTFDDVTEDIYRQSLVFILDTVASQMLDPLVYQHYHRLVLIDHHQNDPDIDYDIAYQVKDASSCSEIIAKLLLEWQYPINADAARALYIGIIGDTGRFMHSQSSETFRVVATLLDAGIDTNQIHNQIYVETKKKKEIKNAFFSRVNYSKHNVAYCKNDADFMARYQLTSNEVSRGFVNQMAGMVEVPIWVNFTLDTETRKILTEIRARDIVVVNVAKKYGGGGHNTACGCTLDNWEETDQVIQDLDRLAEAYNG